MAIQQMICFVTPGAPLAVAPSVTRRIDAMCLRIGRIHFATLALLPPRPETPPEERAPSLLLEVVVDEDLLPEQLVERMVATAFPVLWRLYRANWNGPADADPHSKRDWLRAFLVEHASPADGGYVGARDRNVTQVRAEARLFEAAREELHRQAATKPPADTRAIADHLVDWAQRHGFGWIADPAPRSRWRKGPGFGALDWALLSARLLVPLVAFLGLLTALGWAVMLGGKVLSFWEIPVPHDVLSGVVLAALALLVALLVPLVLASFTGIGILALAALVLGFAVLAVVSAVSGSYMAIADSNLAWPTCTFNLMLLGLASLLSFVAALPVVALLPVLFTLRAPPFFPALATLGAMVLAGAVTWVFTQLMFAFAGATEVCGHAPLSTGPSIDLVGRLGWAAAALASVAGVLVVAVLLATRWMPQLVAFAKYLDRPKPLPALPAHQVHPSIQACEAALSARTSHMISLTEIRRPYLWHRSWLRFWLWFFSVLGDTVFTEGILGRARGIKFGHWHIIDRGRRLLFCSNFDDAFGGYLDEFISGATEGVNLIWRRSELRERDPARPDQPGVEFARRFPPTRLGIYKGCKAEQAFKAYTRASMLPFLHRFEAYTLSNEDVERATRLREALRGGRNAQKDDQVARALES